MKNPITGLKNATVGRVREIIDDAKADAAGPVIYNIANDAYTHLRKKTDRQANPIILQMSDYTSDTPSSNNKTPLVTSGTKVPLDSEFEQEMALTDDLADKCNTKFPYDEIAANEAYLARLDQLQLDNFGGTPA